MANIELTTISTVPTNTSLSITVYEDTSLDGTANTAVTQSVADGTNTYTLSGFEGGVGNDYWLKIEPGTSDLTTTASLGSATVDTLSGNTVTDAGSVTTAHASTTTSSETPTTIDDGSPTSAVATTLTADEQAPEIIVPGSVTSIEASALTSTEELPVQERLARITLSQAAVLESVPPQMVVTADSHRDATVADSRRNARVGDNIPWLIDS